MPPQESSSLNEGPAASCGSYYPFSFEDFSPNTWFNQLMPPHCSLLSELGSFFKSHWPWLLFAALHLRLVPHWVRLGLLDIPSFPGSNAYLSCLWIKAAIDDTQGNKHGHVSLNMNRYTVQKYMKRCTASFVIRVMQIKKPSWDTSVHARGQAEAESLSVSNRRNRDFHTLLVEI